MSQSWHFYSLDASRLNDVIGSGDPAIEQLVIEAATWDTWEGQDTEALVRLAKQLVNQNAPYSDLDEKDSEILDELVELLFSPEGLAEELQVAPLSLDGLHPSVISELLDRAQSKAATSILEFLRAGRRLGQMSHSPCNYCLLSNKEVRDLAEEVRTIMQLPDAWTDDNLPNLVEECLLSVLQTSVDEGRELIGLLG